MASGELSAGGWTSTLFKREQKYSWLCFVLTQISLVAWDIILFFFVVISDSAQVFASSFGGPIRPSITKQQETSSPAGHAVYQGSFTSSKPGNFILPGKPVQKRGWYP